MASVPGVLNTGILAGAVLNDSISLFSVANRPTSTTLNTTIDDNDTSIVLVDASNYPASGAISIGDEIIYYSGKASNTLTVTLRGADGTVAAGHTSGVPVKMNNISAHHEILRDAIINLETALGSGDARNFVPKTGNFSVSGNKTFTGLTLLGGGAYSNESPAATATPAALVVADSSVGTPTASLVHTAAFQTWRIGDGTVIAYPFTLIKSAGEGELYNGFFYSKWNPNMSDFLTDVNHVNLRSDLFMLPTNIGARQIVGYGAWLRAGRGAPAGGAQGVSGIRAVGAQVDAWNNTASQCDFDAGSINSTIGLAINCEPGLHNSVALYIQSADAASAWSLGSRITANSVYRYGHDTKDASFQFTGTFTTTTNTITGSGSILLTEAVIGDMVKYGSVWYRVTAVGSDTSLTVTPNPGTQGTPDVLSKAIIPLRLRVQGYVVARNNADNADYKFFGLTDGDTWAVDTNARGVNFGTYTSYGTNATGAPSDTITSGYRIVAYDGGTGARYGWGIEGGYLWYLSGGGGGHKFYVNSSTTLQLALTIEASKQATFASTVLAPLLQLSQSTIQNAVSGAYMQAQGIDGSASFSVYDTYAGENGVASSVIFRAAKGSAATPTALTADHPMGSIGGRGYFSGSGAGFSSSFLARIVFYAAEALTNTNQGSYIGFDTVKIGTVTRSEKMRLLDTGRLKLLSTTDAAITLPEISTTPPNPSSGNEVHMYMKADKLIFSYNDGGTIHYKYLTLSGSGATWTDVTSAP